MAINHALPFGLACLAWLQLNAQREGSSRQACGQSKKQQQPQGFWGSTPTSLGLVKNLPSTCHQ